MCYYLNVQFQGQRVNRIIDVEIRHEMEVNVEETKVMKISRQTIPVQIMIDQQYLQKAEYLNYLCGMIAHDAGRTREMKARTDMAKAAFDKKKTLFANRIGLI